MGWTERDCFFRGPDSEDLNECFRRGQSLFYLWDDRKSVFLIVRQQGDYFIKVMLPFWGEMSYHKGAAQDIVRK